MYKLINMNNSYFTLSEYAPSGSHVQVEIDLPYFKWKDT